MLQELVRYMSVVIRCYLSSLNVITIHTMER